ncbi:MAG: hypothetical protein IKL20_04870 [Alistipes sp.]|nr:hypothetical protein [Alistipes sp.]
MKKVALLLLSVFAVIGASAQTGASMKRVLEGSMILAQRNLSEDGKEFVRSFLGQSFYEDVQYLYYLEKKNQAEYSSDIHFLYLDKNFRPMKREGDDLIATIEASMAIVRDREGRERAEVVMALRTIINLMSDMHNIGHVRLESVPHSMQDFKIWRYNGDTPKYIKRKYQVEWSRFWNVYSGSHSGMTGAMWADDYELAYGAKANEYAAGSLYDWVADIGKSANEIYKWAVPDYEMSRIQRNDLEDFYFEMMAKLGYRLAKMLDMLAQQQ